MPQFIRHHVNPATHSTSTHSTWALPILAGILVGFLLAFVANYLAKTEWVSGFTKAAFVIPAPPETKPDPEIKKPVRYGAIISNWQQYRVENQARD